MFNSSNLLQIEVLHGNYFLPLIYFSLQVNSQQLCIWPWHCLVYSTPLQVSEKDPVIN